MSFQAKPFVKWVGGKKQLLDTITSMMPPHFNKYYEPFVGGGAVYFEIVPTKAWINDINTALINTYKRICESPNDVYSYIKQLDTPLDSVDDYYYNRRAYYNEKLKSQDYDIEMAALFIFLNKHCFNGVYRVNRKGYFNVPYNGKTTPSCTLDELCRVSECLKGTLITNDDFEIVCNNATTGDFIFLDPPYAKLQSSTFDSYTGGAFQPKNNCEWLKCLRNLAIKDVMLC